MSGDAEDFEVLAGLYVLGVLDLDEAQAVEELAARQPEVGRAIEAWQNRLAPLAFLVPPATPPADLWNRIASSTGYVAEPPPPQPAPPQAATKTPLFKAWRSLALWRAAAAGFAVAAAVALYFVVSRPEPVPYAAALSPVGSPAPVFLAQRATDGSLQIHPLAPVQVPVGKDLELWALPTGAKAPVSLGVLPSIGRSVASRPEFGSGVQLLVSLEPTGGSPTGQPTGPVLYGGTLKPL